MRPHLSKKHHCPSEVAEKGYARTADADVIARAGVSRKSFYEHFANKEARTAFPALPVASPSRLRACVGAINELVVEHVRVAAPQGLDALTEPVVDVVVGLLLGHDTPAALQQD